MNEQFVICGVTLDNPGGIQIAIPFGIDKETRGLPVVLVDQGGDVIYLESIIFPVNGIAPVPAPNRWLETIAAQFTLDYTAPDPVLRPVRTNGGVPVTDADVVVTAANTVLAAANVARRSLLLQNNGVTDVWLRFGAAAAAGARLLLQAGATMQFSGESCPDGIVNGILDAAGNNTVYVLET